MAILRINAARDGTLSCPDAEGAWTGVLDRALDAVPPGAPVCLLVHGYRFSFRSIRGRLLHCAQELLYRPEEVRPTRHRRPPLANWPRRLGFTGDDPAEGLCIGFGWDGRRNPLGALAGFGRNDFALVYEAAATAGGALARLLGRIAERRPDLAPDFLTHSLGARVALSAMAARPDLRLGRAILLGAAEYAGTAARVLDRQEAAGGTAEVYHVMSRANDIYDALFRLLAPRPALPGDPTLGLRGLGAPRHARRWIDVQLDHPETVAFLHRRGHALERAGERVSHWHFYADPGAMSVWRAILRDRDEWRIAALRAAGADRLDPRRFSRLVPALPGFRPAEAPPLLTEA